MAKGAGLYVDVADHKSPGVYALAAGAVELFASPHRALRVLTYLVATLSGVLVYVFGRDRFDKRTGMTASLLFLLVAYLPHFDGFFFRMYLRGRFNSRHSVSP